MILHVHNEKEAVDTARQLNVICNDIRMAFITEEIKAQSYENFLCALRDSIQVMHGLGDDAMASGYPG